MSNQPRDDEPTFFVSRRGRQVGLHEVDLKGIDVETDDAAPITASKPTRKDAKLPNKTSVRPVKQKRSRRAVMITAVILGLLVLAPLAVAELVAAQYRGAGAAARQSISQVVSSDVLPLQKKASVSADQLRTIAGKVNDIATSMCRGGLLDNAASLYPRAKQAHDQCKASQRSYTAVAAALYELEAQARYLERLGSVIRSVTTPITDEYAVIAAQQTAWQTATDGLKKLAPPAAMSTAHSELQEHVSAIAGAWSSLSTASNDQDADAFTAAEKTLTTEYEAVRGSSEQLLAVLRDTQARLTGAYASLR
jgi:hypothetical protein